MLEYLFAILLMIFGIAVGVIIWQVDWVIGLAICLCSLTSIPLMALMRHAHDRSRKKAQEMGLR